VIVIGTTNRPEVLDSSLRRAGRFDKEISLGIPDERTRTKILELYEKVVEERDQLRLTLAAQASELAQDHSSVDAYDASLFSSFDPMRPESISECSFPILPSGAAPGRVVSADPFFTRHREQLVALAAQHHIPAIYQWRDFAEMGGLISYGADRADIYRQPGIYVGRVLGGTKPSDLPVMQPTKFELVLTKSGQGPQPDGSSIHPAAS